MRRVISKLLREPCRIQEISEDERTTFGNYSHLQRYHSGLDSFFAPSASRRLMTLPSRYVIEKWSKSGESGSAFLRGNRIDTLEQDTSNSTVENVNIFTKVIHLLDPIGILREEYMTPEHPLLPQGERAWRQTLQKLHSRNNQAYVDTVANFVMSRFRELDLTPHCILNYGSLTGISTSYKYRISDDFSSYRQCRWFWRGINAHGAKIEALKSGKDISTDPDMKEIYDTYFTSPFTEDELIGDDDSVAELSSDNLPSVENIEDGTTSLHSFDFGAKDDDELYDSNLSSSASASDEFNIDNTDTTSDSDSDSDDTDIDSDETDIDINLEIPSMPVIIIYQEAQEGTMDELLDMDEISGHKRGTKSWEKVWLAWIWQVVSTLSFLQNAICFTHNDLHTNNILWRETTEEFIYYKARDGTVWRVPTYGKIFSIIDFGRSIFRLGRQLWVSDDHWPEHDAGGQYNFGPFFQVDTKKVPPNPSFDLCRLAVSMIDGLFDEQPSRKRGRTVPEMSKEGSWIVYETISPLFNLLYSWTIDDSGKTIYEDRTGDERYPGFELYIRIAHDVHCAIPREQVTRPAFDIFRLKTRVPEGKTVYSIGC